MHAVAMCLALHDRIIKSHETCELFARALGSGYCQYGEGAVYVVHPTCQPIQVVFIYAFGTFSQKELSDPQQVGAILRHLWD